LYKIRLKY